MKAIKIFAAVLMASMVMSCGTTPKENVKVDVELPSAALVDSVSYLLGVNFGSIIKGNNFAETMDDFNMNELKKGIADFLAAEGQPFDPGFEDQWLSYCKTGV